MINPGAVENSGYGPTMAVDMVQSCGMNYGGLVLGTVLFRVKMVVRSAWYMYGQYDGLFRRDLLRFETVCLDSLVC